jgi:hypothetical protein
MEEIENKLTNSELVMRYIALNRAKGIIEKNIEDVKAQQIATINKIVEEQNVSFNDAINQIPDNLKMNDYQLRVEYNLNLDLIKEKYPESIVYEEEVVSSSNMPEAIKNQLKQKQDRIAIKQTKDVKNDPEILKLVAVYTDVELVNYQTWLKELKSYISEDALELFARFKNNPKDFEAFKSYINFESKDYSVAVEYGIYNVNIKDLKSASIESITRDVINTYETKQVLMDEGINIESVSVPRFVKEKTSNSIDDFDGIEYGNKLSKNAIDYVNAVFGGNEDLIKEIKNQYFEILKK